MWGIAVCTFLPMEIPMPEYRAALTWSRTTPDFSYETYDRAHTITTGGGLELPASSAAEYSGDAARLNPEEGLIGALNSCHMLTFLAVAARRHVVVDRYACEAVGTLEKDAQGRLSITKIHLRPQIAFSGEAPDADALNRLHEAAHRNCFIANSIRAAVTWEGQPERSPDQQPASAPSQS